MLAQITAATPWGIEARAVQIEVDVQNGLPQTQIVGLPDAAVRESRERVRSAVRNCGFDLPPRSVVINLAPADLRKEGNHLDIGVALGLLIAHGRVPQEAVDHCVVAGELGLDGSVRPIRGALAIADLAQKDGADELLVPERNATEAASLGGPRVIPVSHLQQAIDHLMAVQKIPPVETPSGLAGSSKLHERDLDLSDVRGQETAKRALEIAAAGGHNLLLIGPPGSGKTLLAQRLPGLLPPLTLREAIDVTKIHSMTADVPPDGLVRERPFRSPHPSISTAGLVGGGSFPQPGEVSLAHHGALFLDELPEFRRDTLEALRHPLEDGVVTVARARARLMFPARLALVAAMNPCPCGHLGDARNECRCSAQRISKYRGKISGPLLDRIDLHVEVPSVTLEELRSAPGETSASVRARVTEARVRQSTRFSDLDVQTNAAAPMSLLDRHCQPEPEARRLLDLAFDNLRLSARALHRVLRVARTIADLEGAKTIASRHVAEAIQYRTLDRRVG